MKILKCKICNKKITTGSKLGMCASCSSQKRWQSPEEHEKHSKALKDKPKSKEHIENMRKARIGKPSGMLGKKHTEESRDKMSKSHKGKKRSPHSKKTIEKISGKNSVHYIHGQSKSSYSKEFTPELKNSIKERDNLTCQNPKCNCTQEQHLEKYNLSLEIHHIDYDRYNCEKTNLITLCKQCNISANYNRDYFYALYTYINETKKEKTNGR
jgi:hypothetical protein